MRKSGLTVLASVGLAAFLSPAAAFCEWDLNSQFAFTIPSAFLDHQVANVLKQNSNLKFTIPDQVVNSTIATTLSQISVEVQTTNATSTVVQSGQNWALALPAVGAKITIGSVNASQTIEQIVGGVHVSVSVTGSCSNIVLTLPATSAQIAAGVSLAVNNNQATAQLTNFQMNWGASAWQISGLNCQGAQGFGAVVGQYLNAYLAQPANLQALTQTYLQNSMNQSVASSVQSIFNGLSIDTKRTDIKLSAKSNALKSVTHGYVMTGNLIVQLPLANPGQFVNETAAPLPDIADAGTATSASFSFPDSVVSSLIQHLHETHLLEQTFLSTDVASLNGFLHSRFEEFFVFKDLMHFSKDAVFHFLTALNSPATSTVNEAIAKNSTGVTSNLLVSVQMALSLQMQAPLSAGYVPYVNFQAPLQTQALIQIASGQLSAQLSQVSLQLNAGWDSDYVTKYKPNTSIWISPITGKVKSALSDKPLVYTLPVLSVGVIGQTYKATSVAHDANAKAIHVFVN